MGTQHYSWNQTKCRAVLTQINTAISVSEIFNSHYILHKCNQTKTPTTSSTKDQEKASLFALKVSTNLVTQLRIHQSSSEDLLSMKPGIWPLKLLSVFMGEKTRWRTGWMSHILVLSNGSGIKLLGNELHYVWWRADIIKLSFSILLYWCLYVGISCLSWS